MINLLPPEEKRILEAEKKFKLVVIWGVIVLFALISLSLILLPIKFYVSGMAQNQEILVNLEEERFQESQTQALADEIKNANEEVRQLRLFYQNQISFSGALTAIALSLPSQIQLDSFVLNLQSKEDKQILRSSLTGHSPDRDALFLLKKNLEGESSFKKIDFPPSNWVKPANFSVSFNIEI